MTLTCSDITSPLPSAPKTPKKKKKRMSRLQNTKRKMQKLWDEGHRTCYYCKRTTIDHVGHRIRGIMWTVDHIIPRSEGGSDAIDNMVMSCYSCNRLRGTIPYDYFSKHVYDMDSYNEFAVRGKRLYLKEHGLYVDNKQKSIDKQLSDKRKAFALFLMDYYGYISLPALYNYFNAMRDMKYEALMPA